MTIMQELTLDPASTLKHTTRVKCVLGRDKLLSWMNERHISCILEVSEVSYNLECSGSFVKCAPERKRLVRQFELWDNNDLDLFAQWQRADTPNPQICQSCQTALKKTHDDIRKDAWAKLPSFFGLPDWADLKDRD